MGPIVKSMLLAFGGGLLLVGCAAQPPKVWYSKTHDNPAQFERDKAQCIYEAAQATGSYSQGQTARTNSGAFVQGFSEGLTISMRREELGLLCMKSKGYVLK